MKTHLIRNKDKVVCGKFIEDLYYISDNPNDVDCQSCLRLAKMKAQREFKSVHDSILDYKYK